MDWLLKQHTAPIFISSFLLMCPLFFYVLLPTKILNKRIESSKHSYEDMFSSFHCHAGSQAFDFRLQVTQHPPQYPPVDSPMGRMCLLRNVCLLNGDAILSYYADPMAEGSAPELMRMENFGGWYNGFIDVILNRVLTKPKIVWGPRPSINFEPDNLFVMDEMSDPSNYAHLLLDTILPLFSVADVYGTNADNIQLIETVNCSNWLKPNMIVPGIGLKASALCEKNLGVWAPLLLNHPILLPPFKKKLCFKRLIVGQAGSMSLAGEFARGSQIRAARKSLFEKLDLNPHFYPSKHHVVVFEKAFFNWNVEVDDICAKVKAWVAFFPDLLVSCIKPANLTPTEQMKFLQEATVVVSEHGSTSYTCMFQTPGTALLLLAPLPDPNYSWAKEPQVMLYLTDLFVLYLDGGRIVKDGPSTMQLLLSRAGQALKLPQLFLFNNTKS